MIKNENKTNSIAYMIYLSFKIINIAKNFFDYGINWLFTLLFIIKMIKKLTIWKIKNLIDDYFYDRIEYKDLENVLIEYSKKNKKTINLDYVKNRIDDIYKIKWIVWVSSFDILLENVYNYIKHCFL